MCLWDFILKMPHRVRGINFLVLSGFFMAALRSRCGHYIFALWFLSSMFYLLSFFIPRLISAVAAWMPTILSTRGVALVRI